VSERERYRNRRNKCALFMGEGEKAGTKKKENKEMKWTLYSNENKRRRKEIESSIANNL
jgi:hypothetical protein